ncbi:dimethylarginine dimethylaminohydrolase family protein [Alkalihalobacillus sp. LMS39]|uniref:dimethylarginine dimethylaminohydrolase family protein n=1 Tax=Alkalihalobacillus sp. LMS39 TaxID=2924032 RepID=UPI001FB4C4B8|nr:dimethylarginine dimethylaminohydrolase family protein [Alkalihalobacillus sp. LMS39]UOE92049.1 dimethylarginine dimethylaminohydrolase family protein [Alkalihalobacillus sp. LMS39]
MSILTKIKPKTYCHSEYDVLKQVILCEPKYMTIREQINDTQKHFFKEGIDLELAAKQHKDFVKALKKEKIDVVLLPPNEKFPEQVFTRDIGFTLGHTIFVAEMAHKIRQGEEEFLKTWLKNSDISYYNLVGDMIEGGDVMIDHRTIFIGLSNRTNQKAIDHIQNLLEDFEVITVPFTEKYLHLDCVFNIISRKEALVYPEALTKKEYQILEKRYDLIEVSKEEQFTLGTNILSIGNKKIISLPVNKNVNEQLRKRGFEVIEVDITEIIKSGGSFRCCTLPTVRENEEVTQ